MIKHKNVRTMPTISGEQWRYGAQWFPAKIGAPDSAARFKSFCDRIRLGTLQQNMIQSPDGCQKPPGTRDRDGYNINCVIGVIGAQKIVQIFRNRQLRQSFRHRFPPSNATTAANLRNETWRPLNNLESPTTGDWDNFYFFDSLRESGVVHRNQCVWVSGLGFSGFSANFEIRFESRLVDSAIRRSY